MVKESPSEHSIAYRMRLAAGKTEEEAAALLQVSVRSWQRFEARERNMPERIVREFCRLAQLDDRVFLPGAVDRERELVSSSPLKAKDVE